MNAVAFAAAQGGMPHRNRGSKFGWMPQDVEERPANGSIAPVKALLIDPENVLYDVTLWRRWLHQVLMRLGKPAPFAEFFEAWDRCFRLPVDLGRREYWDAFHDFLAHQGLTQSQIIEVLAAAICRKRRFEKEKRPLPGAKETLSRLAAGGVALCILSNTSQRREELLAELECLGYRNIFDGALTSRDLGYAMPAPATYHEAVRRLELDGATTAFLGSGAIVLRGAQRCGLRTIAWNADREAGADLTLENFADLTTWAAPPHRARLAG